MTARLLACTASIACTLVLGFIAIAVGIGLALLLDAAWRQGQ